MEFKEIQDLLKLVNRSNLIEVEIKKEDFRIKISKKDSDNVIYTTPSAAPIPMVSSAPAPVAPAPVAAETSAPAPQAESEAPAVKAEEKNDNLIEFKSPMIGTYYTAPSPESPPYLKVGDVIAKGQVVCIIEAMKLFNEIESEVSGKVVKLLVENAQPVEFDQPLFLIDPNG